MCLRVRQRIWVIWTFCLLVPTIKKVFKGNFLIEHLPPRIIPGTSYLCKIAFQFCTLLPFLPFQKQLSRQDPFLYVNAFTYYLRLTSKPT